MGEGKRKARELIIVKATLLGYTFERGEFGKGWRVRLPNTDVFLVVHGGGLALGTTTFCARWYAAHHALIHAGVVDAPVARGDTGVGSGKSFRLRGGRRDRRRAIGKSKSVGAGPR